MNTVSVQSLNFDIGQIAASGQCFRMNPHPSKPDTFTLIAHGQYLELTQEPGSSTVEIGGITEKEYSEKWAEYFDSETEYEKIISSIDPEDEYLTNAAQLGRGIRILHQDLWETMVSFIISQQNNIPRIKKSIETLCRSCGERKTSENGVEYWAFPTADDLLEGDKLKPAKLGYRERYIRRLAQQVADGDIILSDLKTKEQLLQICGIGEKVANCIMLFGLHDLSCFPIDVWMKRIIQEHYQDNFPIGKYREYAGVIQQYMFNAAIHSRSKKIKGK